MNGARPLRSTRRLQNLQRTLPKWYTITNSAAGLPTQVSIYDEIGFFGVSAGEFLADLKAINGDIELHVNSPGGDVHDGIAIYNQLKQRAGTVTVIIDGLAASAASFIAQAASPGKLEIAPHAQMMIHNGFSMGIGDAEDLRKTADLLDSITAEIAGIYADRTGKPAEHWLALMKAETWFTDKQAVAEGLADKIHGTDDEPGNSWDLSVFAHYTDPGGKDGGPGAVLPPVIVNADGTHASMSGTHTHSHPAYGSQGGDTVHSHEHSHDGDASHGHHQAAPDADNRQHGAVTMTVDNSPWDGSKAMANGAAADDPAKFYAGICAGKRDGDPSKQSSWALPYKYHPGDAPNAAGTRNALARLPQTQGLTNAAQAKATLTAAMKQVDPDYDPEDRLDPGLLGAAFALALEGGHR